MIYCPAELAPTTVAEMQTHGYHLGLWSEHGGFPRVIAWLASDEKAKMIKNVRTWMYSYGVKAWLFSAAYNSQVPKAEVQAFDLDTYNSLVEPAQQAFALERTIEARVKALPMIDWDAGVPKG